MPLSNVWRGNASLIAGASRNAVKLDRAWQQDLDSLLAQKCPFEDPTNKQEIHLDEISRGGENWRVLRNRFTPWTELAPDHFLIIPQKCWPKDELRRLGQTGKLAGALSIVGDLCKENAHAKFLMCVHVGRNAGQNVGHAHFHVLPLPTDRMVVSRSWLEEIEEARHKPQLKQGDKKFLVFCDGTRAGQCFVVSEDHAKINDWDNALAFARKLDELLELYGRKFRSVQGLPPDFIVNAVIHGGDMEFATIIPILSQWGGPEYLATMEGSPFSLPWEHQVSADHLNTD